MEDWVECGSCQTEFKVISDIDDIVAFCPYCGADIEIDDEEEEFEEDQDYDFDE